MPSCHPKTDHALCTNTVIFPLVLGLYFCCNAKENRKKKKREPVNTFRVPDSAWLDGSQFPSTFFKHLFIQGRYCWACPACSIEALCIQALWRCIMEMHYGDASCSCSIPQVITAQPRWTLLGFSCLARVADCCWGTGERLSFPIPTKSFSCRLTDLNWQNFQSDAFLRLSGEGRVLRVHLTCHEFAAKMWTNGIWQEWLLRTGGPLLMACL